MHVVLTEFGVRFALLGEAESIVGNFFQFSLFKTLLLCSSKTIYVFTDELLQLFLLSLQPVILFLIRQVNSKFHH